MTCFTSLNKLYGHIRLAVIVNSVNNGGFGYYVCRSVCCWETIHYNTVAYNGRGNTSLRGIMYTSHVLSCLLPQGDWSTACMAILKTPTCLSDTTLHPLTFASWGCMPAVCVLDFLWLAYHETLLSLSQWSSTKRTSRPTLLPQKKKKQEKTHTHRPATTKALYSHLLCPLHHSNLHLQIQCILSMFIMCFTLCFLPSCCAEIKRTQRKKMLTTKFCLLYL